MLFFKGLGLCPGNFHNTDVLLQGVSIAADQSRPAWVLETGTIIIGMARVIFICLLPFSYPHPFSCIRACA